MGRIARRKTWKPLPSHATVVRDRNGKLVATWSVRGQSFRRPVSDDGSRYLLESKFYTVHYTPAAGPPEVAVKTRYTDKSAAEAFLRKLEQDEEDKKRGVYDDSKSELSRAQARPFAEHLADYEQSLRDSGRTGHHVSTVTRRIERIGHAASIDTLADLRLARVQRGLAAVAESRDSSDQTKQHYVRSVKAFSHWLHLDGRVASDPLLGLKAGKVVERRRERRILSAAEFEWLLRITGTRNRRNQKILGRDRVVLYLVLSFTGFRLKETCSLTRRQFRERGDGELVVQLAARKAKNRKDAERVVPKAHADGMRQWLASKPDGLLFDKPSKFSKNLRRDMAAARTAWIAAAADDHDCQEREASDFLKYEDSLGRFADNHSFRGLYCTTLLMTAGDRKTLLEASRHSDIGVASRYLHPSNDVMAAVQHRVGELLPAWPGSAADAARPHRADDAQCAVQCAIDASHPVTNGHSRALGTLGPADRFIENTPENEGFSWGESGDTVTTLASPTTGPFLLVAVCGWRGGGGRASRPGRGPPKALPRKDQPEASHPGGALWAIPWRTCRAGPTLSLVCDSLLAARGFMRRACPRPPWDGHGPS